MKKITGQVLSDKMAKTKVVEVISVLHHPIYSKTFKKTKKILADDPKNIAKVGDMVEITSVRPISKNKSFQITKVEGQK